MEEQQEETTPVGETVVATVSVTKTPAPAPAGRTTGKKGTTTGPADQTTVVQQAETIKQLQRQMKALEEQTKDTGKVFLATITSLITSAFALVAALAWNGAIQDLFELLFPPKGTTTSGDQVVASTTVSGGQVAGEFGYALVVTVIVVLVIFYLTQLNTKIGGKSLIGDSGKSDGGKG